MGLPRIRKTRSSTSASRGQDSRGDTRSQSRSSRSKNKRKNKVSILGGLGAGLLGALGGLFGGGLAKGPADPLKASGGDGGSRGSGKANYGPMPSFSIQSKAVSRYNNPTLATISMQMAMLLKEMGLVESALMAQFKQQQFTYTDAARAQREINTESRGAGFVPFVAPDNDGAQLGALSIKQLNDSFMQFSKALDDATEALNNMDCSCDGGDIDLPTIVPSGELPGGRDRTRGSRANTARLVEAGKSTRFVSRSTALNSRGLLNAGYEAVFNKRTGAVAGYREVAGWGGRWSRRAGEFSQPLGRAAERISGGINAGGRAINRFITTPAANLISRSSQFLKRATTRSATAVSQSAFTRNAGRFIRGSINLAKAASETISTGVRAVGRFALRRGLTIAFVAYESWNTYQEIKALPSNLTTRQRRNAIARIIGKLVANIGLVWAGAALGTLLGTAVPGPGWLVGFLGGLVGGLVADFFFGNSVDKLVDMAVNALYPADKDGEAARRVPTARRDELAPTPMSVSRQGEGTVPFRRSAVTSNAQGVTAALRTPSNKTVNDLINDTATRVGVDPSLMSLIASENAAFDPTKRVQNVNGSEIFKLTPQQWSSLTFRYGARYPELYAGINDPRAATTAGALLIKDSQDFLAKNSIPISPLSLYGSYLLGNEGLRTLLNSQPSDIASNILPEAALARPELFKDAGGDITTNTLMQRLYNRTLPERQRPSTPQGAPVIPPPVTAPSAQGLPSQPQPPTPPNPNAGGATSQQSTRTAAASLSGQATPMPAAASQPSATPDGSSGAAAAPDASSTYGPTAEPVPPSATAAPGAVVDERTRELEQAARDAQAVADNPVVVQAMGGGRRAPAVLPSSRAGYTGTGNVPDPTYAFMDQYEYQFRFKSSPVLATAQTSWA